MSISKAIDLCIIKNADNRVSAMSAVDRVITQNALEDDFPISPLSQVTTRVTLLGIVRNSTMGKALLQSLREHAQMLNLHVRPWDVAAWEEGRDAYIKYAPKTAVFSKNDVFAEDRRYVHACLVKNVHPEGRKIRSRFPDQWEILVMNHHWEELIECIKKDGFIK